MSYCPLRCSSAICERSLSISSLMCCAPCTAAFSLRRTSSRSAYSLSSLAISSFSSSSPPRGSFVLFLLHRLELDLQLNQPAIENVHHLRLRIDFHLDARRRFVDQIDRLVGQESIGDVAMRKLGRGDDRRIGDLDAVMQLVAFLQPAQDRDRRFDARLVDQHFLKAPLECSVFFDVLAVFVQRGGADAVQLAARQRRLQHVAGVDRALGASGADDRVHLVDEQNDAAGFGGDFLQHGFQPLFKLAAVLRAGQQARHVEHQHALALQGLGHFLVDDALRQALDDRGLADAGLADQHRIVFRTPLQDLNRAADLVVAPDHRIELALLRALGQIDRVFVQRLALSFGFRAIDLVAAAHRVDRGFECLLRQIRARARVGRVRSCRRPPRAGTSRLQ